MLVLRRTEGQWVEVTHKSGDTLKFRVYDLCGETPGRVHLAFEDAERNFEIQRPERRHRSSEPGPAYRRVDRATAAPTPVASRSVAG